MSEPMMPAYQPYWSPSGSSDLNSLQHQTIVAAINDVGRVGTAESNAIDRHLSDGHQRIVSVMNDVGRVGTAESNAIDRHISDGQQRLLGVMNDVGRIGTLETNAVDRHISDGVLHLRSFKTPIFHIITTI